MSTHGYHPSGGASDVEFFADGTEQVIAYIPDRMPQHGWAYSMNVRVGPNPNGTRHVVAAITDTNPNPHDVLAQTDDHTITNPMTTPSSGSTYTWNLQSAQKLQNARTYGFMVESIGGETGIGSIHDEDYPGKDNYLVYHDSDSALPIKTTFTNDRSETIGHLAISVNYEPNVAPDIPLASSMSPAEGSTQASTTPTFTAGFVDANEAMPNGIVGGDTMQSFTIEVRKVSDNSLVWSLVDELTTHDERNARAYERTSPPLPAGVALRWRTEVFDQFGVASGMSGWQHFTAGTGGVTVTAPYLKQNTIQPSFSGIWSHPSLDANAARVRIRGAASGSILRQIPSGGFVTLSPTIDPDDEFIVPWADTGFADLQWGGSYTVEIQARSTAGNWSGWSTPLPFTVNAAPSTPTLLTPRAGEISTNRPMVNATSSDADDNAATGFVVYAVFREVTSGDVHGPYAMSLVGTSHKLWELQTTATHLPVTDDYQWWAYSYDGTVYSGKTTVEADASHSAIASFVYADGPEVDVSYPTVDLVIETDTPTITWTTPGSTQTQYRVRVLDQLTDDEVYDTNFVLSATQEFEIPTGYLHHEGLYKVKVFITNDVPLDGASEYINFSVLYDEPIAVSGISASLQYATGDTDPSVVRLTWTEGELQDGETFEFYRIAREPTDDTPIRVEDIDRTTRQVILTKLGDITQVSYEDHRAASGITYQYHVRMYVRKGSDRLGSPITKATIRLDFSQGILQQVPENGSVPEHRLSMDFREDVRVGLNTGNVYWRPMNKAKPLVFKSKRFDRPLTGTFVLSADSVDDVEGMIRDFEYMAAQSLPLHWKDGRGRSFYCVIDSATEVDRAGGRIRKLEMTLQPIDYPELYQ